MLTNIISGIFFDPFDEEAMSINEQYESDKANFSKFVSETISGKTISNKTWASLDAQVKDELIRLGYKKEE